MASGGKDIFTSVASAEVAKWPWSISQNFFGPPMGEKGTLTSHRVVPQGRRAAREVVSALRGIGPFRNAFSAGRWAKKAL